MYWDRLLFHILDMSSEKPAQMETAEENQSNKRAVREPSESK